MVKHGADHGLIMKAAGREARGFGVDMERVFSWAGNFGLRVLRGRCKEHDQSDCMCCSGCSCLGRH